MKARLHDLMMSRDGSSVLSITTKEDCRGLWDDLHDADVEVTIRKHKKKRSLDANAYAWLLMDKLSERLGKPKMEIYREAVRNIGGNSEIVCVRDKAVDKLRESWTRNGAGWVTETMPSKIPGCTNVILYYGSSTFDSGQMSRMIDGLIQDCKAVGIETLPPYKVDELMDGWNGSQRL